MVKALKKGVLVALLPLALAACGKDQPKQAEPVKKARPAAPSPVPSPAVDEKKETEVKPEAFDARYRNPFQSHIVMMQGRESSKKIRGPLECCDLDQFTIVAVVVGPDSAFALVQAPDAKRYVVRRGDVMGPRDGKVVKITESGLVVREYVRDEDGAIVTTQDIEVNLPAKKEGGKAGKPG